MVVKNGAERKSKFKYDGVPGRACLLNAAAVLAVVVAAAVAVAAGGPFLRLPRSRASNGNRLE